MGGPERGELASWVSARRRAERVTGFPWVHGSGCQLAVPDAEPGRYQGAEGWDSGINTVRLQSPGAPPYRPEPSGTHSIQQSATPP